MKALPASRRSAGFTLVEVIVSLTIVTLTISLTLGTFMFGLRTMYKDTQRLATNASLRSFMAQISKETLDSSEFYIFPSYQSLGGNVNLTADVSALTTDSYGTDVAHGDCLVLVTRTTIDTNSTVRQVRVYYRVVTVADRNNDAAIRYYETTDWGTSGNTTQTLTQILNGINLRANPNLSGSRQLTERAKGRRIGSTTNYYPIFSSEDPTTTPTNSNVSINVEFITGVTALNMLSSSSFNYTISPRR
ncbi:MAG TPA: prepilin-type N-terminal cleavage/methylation domain-containing protein [Opitutaceae bacterium]|nr:prepilin-type N-terminal cleavage/methylation domain-containing protein [Opitutaceae bacterium]